MPYNEKFFQQFHLVDFWWEIHWTSVVRFWFCFIRKYVFIYIIFYVVCFCLLDGALILTFLFNCLCRTANMRMNASWCVCVCFSYTVYRIENEARTSNVVVFSCHNISFQCNFVLFTFFYHLFAHFLTEKTHLISLFLWLVWWCCCCCCCCWCYIAITADEAIVLISKFYLFSFLQLLFHLLL